MSSRCGQRLLRREYMASRGGWVALVYDRGKLDWEVDVIALSGDAKAVLFVPDERAARCAVRAVGAVYGCEFRELAARAQ